MLRSWKKITEEFLDEQFSIIQMLEKRNEDSDANTLYYSGALRAVECLGYAWSRKDGKHYLSKQ